MASMRVNSGGLFAPREITIVDDVLTLGRTAMAAALLLQAQYPGVPVRIFAVMRTQSFVQDIEKLFDPSAGVILGYPSGKTHREP